MLGYFSFYQVALFKAPFFFYAKFQYTQFSLWQIIHPTEAHYRSLHTNCTLESTVSRIFLFSFDFFLCFVFFFLSIMFSSSKLQYSRLYFPFIYEVIEIFINSKLCEKMQQYRSQGGGQTVPPEHYHCEPQHSPSARERVPIFAQLPRRNCERGLVSDYLVKGIVTFDFVLGHKSLEISLKFSQPRFVTAKQKSKLMIVDI